MKSLVLSLSIVANYHNRVAQKVIGSYTSAVQLAGRYSVLIWTQNGK